MTSAFTIALVSLSLSVISTGIAVASYWRTRRIQTYEYAARLQLENESIQGGSGSEAFHYSAELVNVGIKPVEVRKIFIDYGGQSEGTYYKFHVEGLFYLPPNGKRSIDFSMSKEDYEAVLSKFGLKQCLFRLGRSEQASDAAAKRQPQRTFLIGLENHLDFEHLLA